VSRWLDQFKNHVFRLDWAVLKSELENAEIEDESILTSVEELARLKKVVVYLDQLMAFIDPELVPQQTWTNFHKQVAPCKNEVIQFNANKNIAHLTNANEHVDNLLSYVRPWVVSDPVKASKAMSASLETYNSTISEYSEKYRIDAKKLVDELELAKKQASDLLQNVEFFNDAIEKYSDELFEGEDSKESVKETIDTFLAHCKNAFNEINDYYIELLQDNDEDVSIKKKIKEASDEVYEHLSKVVEHLKAVKDDRDDLEEFHKKIFGSNEGDNSSKKEGLKKELDSRLIQLNQYDEEQKSKHSALSEEIEALLPGATSAGLATAFKNMKDSFDKPIKQYTITFYGSLLLIIFVSVVAMTDSIGAGGIKFIKYDDLISFANSLGWKIPVVGTAVWLAIFASKRRSEAHRLQQEYAHKESVAKSVSRNK
jgi:archaellin